MTTLALMRNPKPRIALTMGDPAGVGPEICLRALAEVALHDECQLVVLGDAGVLQACARVTGLPAPPLVIGVNDSWTSLAGPCVIDLGCIDAQQLAVGEVSAASGRASFAYIEAAIAAALAGQVDAVTTAPINKEAFRAAGIHYPGHTEIFAERAASNRWCMMQFSPEITCTFVTVHVGYAEVPKLLTVQRVLETIELTAESLSLIHGRNPRLVVCGLNPHAGARIVRQLRGGTDYYPCYCGSQTSRTTGRRSAAAGYCFLASQASNDRRFCVYVPRSRAYSAKSACVRFCRKHDFGAKSDPHQCRSWYGIRYRVERNGHLQQPLCGNPPSNPLGWIAEPQNGWSLKRNGTYLHLGV